MSDRIAVFNDGVIQQLATPDELYERPQNAFVAQFIGENNRAARQGRRRSTARPARSRSPAAARSQALAVKVAGVGAADHAVAAAGAGARSIRRPASLPNVFGAQVEELIYLGDHIRTRVSVCGNEDFVVKVPNAEGRRSPDAGREDLGRLEDGGLPGARRALTMGSTGRADRSGTDRADGMMQPPANGRHNRETQ